MIFCDISAEFNLKYKFIIRNINMYVIFFKIKSKREKNFITYHFLVESKPHERIYLIIAASMNIYQPKKRKASIPIVMIL